jgi:putative flavoprotein involved in K+ transport
MTQTLDAPPGQSSASDRAEAWFRDFEATLRSRDVGAASAMFATQSFWRDLVSFTWNLTIVENPDGVADLLEANLDRVDPSGFALTEGGGRPGRHTTSGLDVPHHAARAQGSRGAAWHAPTDER